jgi:signal transduction histidine kinase
MKLTTKFTLIFSSIILFMGYISFYGIYSFQYQILEQDITDKLESAAEAHLDRLDRMFYERLQDLELTSRSRAFRSGNRAIQRELDDFLDRYPQFASISYYTMDRARIADAGEQHSTFRRHPLAEYWPDIYAGKDAVVNISRSATLRKPTLHFAVRVKNAAGATLGVLVARIPAAELYGLMESKPDPARPAVRYDLDVLDHDGTILYSNHNPDAILNAIDEDFGLIREALPVVRTVTSLTEIHEVEHSAENKVLMVVAKEQGYRSFRGNGWILKVMYSADQAFAPVAALNRHVFLFLLTISAVGIAAILTVLLITVVRPIKKLNRATTALGEGALDTRVALGAPDEIGTLAQSFNTMADNLKDAREQLANAAETALARASLAERKIIEISEETQRQIGRELHDDLGQQLTGVAFMAEGLHQHLSSQNHPEAENAAKITALINEAIAKAQHLAHDLHPVEMQESGLRAMLMRLASNTQAIFGIKCDFICEGEPRIETPLTDTNLFRIAQEAVHNAVKHSDASKITLTMTATPESLTIEVVDNGHGIGADDDVESPRGLGMNTMRYRASVMNATLHIGDMPGGGTRVAVTLPAPHGRI